MNEDIKQEIRKKGGGYRVIATDYKCVIPTCKNCGKKKEPKDLKEFDWCSSLSMPSSMWKEMEEIGYLVIE